MLRRSQLRRRSSVSDVRTTSVSEFRRKEHGRQAWEVVARTVVVSSKRFELMKVQRVRRKAQHAREPARGHVAVEHRSLAREEDAEGCFSHEHEHAREESTHKQKRCELIEGSPTSNYPSKNEEKSVWDTFGAPPHFRRQARIEKWPLSLRRTLLSDQQSCCSVTAESSQSLPLLSRIVDL